MEVKFNPDGSLKLPDGIKLKKNTGDVQVFGQNDKNLAFKCTYNDKEWKGVCSRKLFEYNRKNHVWCGEYEKHDCQSYKDLELSDSNYPCYESVLFKVFAYSGGMYHSGEKEGEPIPMVNLEVGKIALLTTREPDQDETDRYIIGFLDVREFTDTVENDGAPTGVRIYGDKKTSLKINSNVKLKFWDFYSNKSNPELKHWGSGLFRYLEDETILKFLKALKAEYEKRSISEDMAVLSSIIKRYEDFTK